MQLQENTMIQTIADYKNESRGSDKRFTPRDLINLHMMYPEKPITEEDIENLALGVSAVDTRFLNADSN